MSLRKILRGAAFGLLLLTMTACAETEPPTTAAPETSVESTGAEETKAPATLSARRARREEGPENNDLVLLLTEETEREMAAQIYETLFLWHAEEEPELILLSGLELNEEGDLLCTLKEGVTFHNGETLTADHLAECVAACADSDIFSALGLYCVPEVISETQLCLTFPYAAYGPDAKTLMPLLAEMPVILYEETEEGVTALGTGPYVLSDERKENEAALVRYAAYHGQAGPDRLIYRTVEQSASEAYCMGLTDAAFVTRSEFEELMALDDCVGMQIPGDSVNLLVVNCREGHPGADEAFRTLLDAYLDKSLLNDLICGGNSMDNRLPVSPKSMGWSAEAEASSDTDAVSLESLVLPKELTLLLPGGDAGLDRAVQTLTTDLAKVGIELTCVQAESLSDYQEGDFDLAFINVALGDTPADYAGLFAEATARNLAGLVDEELAAALSGATAENAAEVILAAAKTHAYIALGSPAKYLVWDSRLTVPENGTEVPLYGLWAWNS